jgi:hypothetical protein
MRALTHRSILTLLLAAWLSLSCSSDTPTGPSEQATTGDLQVAVETIGGGTDTDGYIINVAELDDRTIPSNGSILYEGLSPAVYAVSLSGLAANCHTVAMGLAWVPVPASSTVPVPVGRTTEVSFHVWCDAPEQALVVSAAETPPFLAESVPTSALECTYKCTKCLPPTKPECDYNCFYVGKCETRCTDFDICSDGFVWSETACRCLPEKTPF